MKKLLIFLMVAIPLVIILIVNLTVDLVIGSVSISVERISLDRTYIEASIDETLSLNATIYPENASNKEIIWESNNSDVAQVDVNGNVTFVGFGTGYITATSADGGKTASCYFYISDTNVHQVILTAPQSELHIGTTMQLSAQVLPNEALNKNVTYSSDNTDIATVDANGLVYGLSVGNVRITARSVDGGYEDFVNLSVINPVTSIALTEQEAVTAQNYYQIRYTVYPANASNKNVTFEVDDPSVATVSASGQVTFNKTGTVKVTVTTVDGSYSQSMSITFTDGYAQDIKIEKMTYSGTLGDSVFVNYTVIPENIYNTTISFSSDNEDVAYVDEGGYLHMTGGGNTIIHVRVNKNANEVIEKQILVFVESPAQSIEIDDVATAEKSVTLSPKNFPQSSTNTNFFFHSEDERIATVSPEGVVTFVTDQARDVQIVIYANEDLSQVSKRVKVTYTAGMAMGFELKTDTLKMNYGETIVVDYDIYPTNATITNFDIKAQSSNGNEVVKVLPDGSLQAVGGGETIVTISLALYNGQIESKTLKVIVEREVEDIVFDIDLEMQNGIYVTAKQQVTLLAHTMPEDAHSSLITWTVSDKNMGIISGNTFNFNREGTVTLTATSGSVSKEVQIKYTGSYPISAEVGAVAGEEIVDIPSTMYVGDSFEVAITSIFPSNTINKDISLSLSNQMTSSLLGKVLEIQDGKVCAVAGGKATLSVNVSSTILLIYEIEVVRLAQSIDVPIKNSQITSSSIDLTANVLPNDTTNKEVKFEIISDQTGIASLEGSRLTFSGNGIVWIRATSLSDESVQLEFSIEKVQRDAGRIDPNQSQTTLNEGDTSIVDFSSCPDYTRSQISIIKQSLQEKEIISIVGSSITGLNVGEAVVEITLYDQNDEEVAKYLVTIYVVKPIEDILMKDGVEYYNGSYIIGSPNFALDFEVLPAGSEKVILNFEITEQYLESGISSKVASIDEDNIVFESAGTCVLQVSSQDGAVVKNFSIRYTGGNVISATFNVGDEISLNVGEDFVVKVESLLPADATNREIVLSEVGQASGLIAIDNKNKSITALASGQARVLIELSDNITKYITVNILKKVSEISSQSEYISASSTVTISATALPADATNRTLSYRLEENDIATIEGNRVIFTKAGTVTVIISSTDGSEIEKRVQVTSTMGYLASITLNANEKTLSKGGQFSLMVAQRVPNDATHNQVYFEIFSQSPANEEMDEVITLSSYGLIKAISGGQAVVRAYAYGYDGQVIEDFCTIYVNSAVTDLEVVFERELELYQNAYYVTSQSQLDFEVKIYPLDASNKELVYEVSNSSVARVEEGKIVFLSQGQVTIKIASKDTSSGEKSQSFTFYYTPSLLEASVDLSDFTDRTMTLDADKNESYTFKVNKVVPKDNDFYTISLANLTEERNDKEKQVITFDGKTIYAQNGGSATFTLMVGGINVGQFTINVRRSAQDIILVHDENVYTSQPSFSLQAQAYPSDTHEKTITYLSSDTSVASVNGEGLVLFKNFGQVTITMTIESESGKIIKKDVVVQYTNEVQEIEFAQTREKAYVGESIYLSITSKPNAAQAFETKWTVDNENIATLVYNEKTGQYQLTGKGVGKVNVTVEVVGKDISVSKTFEFCPQVSVITLSLDKTNDKNGYASYRVFGSKKFENNSFVEATYQMTFTTSPSNISGVEFEWLSSNEAVASVDGNGLVTFHGTGKVTITLRQRAPYTGAYVASDSYTFTVVDGVDVYNFSEFIKVHEALVSENNYSNKARGIVLHNNIIYDKNLSNTELRIMYNFIYGNGYMLDLTNATAVAGGNGYGKVIVDKQNNVLFDNITFRGQSFGNDNNPALSKLQTAKTVIRVVNGSTNIRFNNCIIENGEICVEIEGSEAYFTGCIIRNSFASGMVVARTPNGGVANVKVEDCIFARSMFGAIFMDIDRSETIDVYNHIELIGNVRIYNWLTLDEIAEGMKGFIASYLSSVPGLGDIIVDSLLSGIKDIIKSQCGDYVYNYNGKEYYEFGLLHAKASLAGIVDFVSNGNYTLKTQDKYAIASNIGGTVAAVGKFTIDIVTLRTNGVVPFIKPSDNYTTNIVENGIIQDIVLN